MNEIDQLSEEDAKYILRRLIIGAGFDDFSIVTTSYGQYALKIVKNSKICPCVVSLDRDATAYQIFAVFPFFRFAALNASTSHRVIISSIIDKNTYLIGIDTTTNKNARYVIAYPNESLIEMKIRCDLMDFNKK